MLTRTRKISLAAAAAAATLTVLTMTFGPEPAKTRVVMVRAENTAQADRIDPSNVEVRRGDVIRVFQAGSLPHRIEILAKASDGSETKVAESPVLTSSGPYTIRVDGRFADGTYEFRCAEHAAQTAMGTVTVKGFARPQAAGFLASLF